MEFGATPLTIRNLQNRLFGTYNQTILFSCSIASGPITIGTVARGFRITKYVAVSPCLRVERRRHPKIYLCRMKVTIIGCGNMGLVYARAFLRYNIVSTENLLLAEKNETRRDELQRMNTGRVVVVTDPSISDSNLVIIAVKPQDFSELAPLLSGLIHPDAIVVSIMAGITIARLEKDLAHTFIIRAMPNSPVEVGMGMTGFSSHKSVSLEQIRSVENLLATTGRTVFFEDENMLNAVTALSGSGPAYFYYIVRAMVEAGKEMGMTEAVASTLVKQTMLGAFQLINNQAKPYDELIKTVASKGGTTEAALSVFENGKMHETMVKGIMRAGERSKELSGG